jgi:molybdate transport system ATP-binding protein
MELTVTVDKKFPGFQLAAHFQVQGERVGIFGASGSGKSTLVGLLAGLMAPDSGAIVLDGVTLFHSGRGINLPPESRRVAMVFQQHCLFPHLNVRKNLLYGMKRCPAQHRVIDFGTLVRVLGLEELLERGVERLSGGERQRVALGRALLSNPRLLLMDEPLSALDDNLRFQIIPYLKSVSEQFGIPYLFISHSLMEMRLMTETTFVFEKGRLVREVGSEELARSCMGNSQIGYINLLELRNMTEKDGMCAYDWQGGELLLSDSNRDAPGGVFELSSRDIILFKKHPEVVSARNLLQCTVVGMFESASKVGVELSCGAGTLVCELVPQAARDLGLVAGATVHAACKASAFRRVAAHSGSG